MKSTLNWLWLIPTLLAFAGFVIGLFQHDNELAGKSILIFAASLSATTLLGIVEIPL